MPTTKFQFGDCFVIKCAWMSIVRRNKEYTQYRSTSRHPDKIIKCGGALPCMRCATIINPGDLYGAAYNRNGREDLVAEFTPELAPSYKNVGFCFACSQIIGEE